MSYPRIATCPLTGIRAWVDDKEHERAFLRQPVIALVSGVLAAVGLLLAKVVFD